MDVVILNWGGKCDFSCPFYGHRFEDSPGGGMRDRVWCGAHAREIRKQDDMPSWCPFRHFGEILVR